VVASYFPVTRRYVSEKTFPRQVSSTRKSRKVALTPENHTAGSCASGETEISVSRAPHPAPSPWAQLTGFFFRSCRRTNTFTRNDSPFFPNIRLFAAADALVPLTRVRDKAARRENKVVRINRKHSGGRYRLTIIRTRIVYRTPLREPSARVQRPHPTHTHTHVLAFRRSR